MGSMDFVAYKLYHPKTGLYLGAVTTENLPKEIMRIIQVEGCSPRVEMFDCQSRNTLDDRPRYNTQHIK